MRILGRISAIFVFPYKRGKQFMKILPVRSSNHGAIFIFMCLFVMAGFLLSEVDCAAQKILTDTERKMKTDGFWVSLHPCPDKIVLSQEEIARLNSNIENDLKLRQDIMKLPALLSGAEIASSLQSILDRYRKRKLFFKDGLPVDAAFYEQIKRNMNFERISVQMPVQFGIIVHMADQRCLPTMESLYTRRLNFEFDMLQDNSFDIGTPVAVVHTSGDEKWYYVIDKDNSGWVKAEQVALCSLNELKEFLSPARFVVMIRAKVSIYLNKSLTEYYDYVRMGTKFPLYEDAGTAALQVGIPFRKADGSLSVGAGYIATSKAHEGYLPYTARTIIEQAFELYNTPYEWGGLNGEQDCSQFIQEVFAVVGLLLPRNSFKQAQVGILIDQFSEKTPNEVKEDSLARKATGGITLLYLKGHIMLFLGMMDDCPYAIHNTWSYIERKTLQGVKTQVVNRVTVTSLLVGWQETEKGPYIGRLLTIRAISNPPQ
jgi:hypothetical protein